MQYLTDGPGDGPLMLFAHGAGAPMDSEFMQVIAEGLAAAGIRVVRFEFPYMAERRESGKKRPPDRQPKLLDCWREVIADVAGDRGFFMAGKSMGGRMASLIADEVGAEGLLCFGYPFYAPGKPEKPRTEHLQLIETPGLILQGSRDPMGNAEAVSGYDLSASLQLFWLEDGNHDLAPRKKSGRDKEQNWQQAVDAAAGFIQALK